MKRTNLKVLSIVLSFFMALSTPISVLADNVTNDSIGSSNMEDKETNVGVDSTQGQETTYSEDITTSKEESTLVYVSQASSFSVIIPKTIILDGKTKSATYEVLVNGNIGGIENVNVIPDSEFVMSQKGKNDIKAIVTQDKTSWVYNEFETKANGSIAANDMTAGSWKGTFNFTIELKSTPFIKVNATNSSGADLNATVSFITGTNKTTLLNELVDGGFIANENEVNALINVETDDFEDTATTTIDVSNFAEKDDIIAIYHYNETLSEWEYIDTCIVDENGQIVANFNSFSPIAFVKKETNHEHSYTSEMIIEPTCAIKGTTKYTCECGYSYTKQDIETIAHNVVNSKCTNCDYIEYVPFTLTSSNINMVGIEASGDMIIPETFEYNGTNYKITQIGEDQPYPGSGKGFNGNKSITSVTIPNSVTKIGGFTFYSCTNLTSIEIPESITSIGSSAFDYCTNLTNIEIPSSVTSIGNSAFKSCTNINVSKENAIYSSINGVLFDKNQKTLISYPKGKTNTTYTIPESVTSIGDNAFENCTSLTKLEISNSVTNIGVYAFGGCTNLTSIEIPESVTSIGNNAFYNVPLIIYNGPATGSPWGAKNLNYMPFELTSTNINMVGIEASGDMIIPATFEHDGIPYKITKIGSFSPYPDSSKSFCYNKNITSVTIPSSVTSIEDYAFYGCSGLTSIEIPNSVKSIGSQAFDGCTSLTRVEIPNSVTSIENYAFKNIPHIIYNGTATGSPWGAKAINYIDFTLTSSNMEMAGITASGVVNIPETFEYNGTHYKIISIGKQAFYNNLDITRVTIPNTVIRIESSAFSGCKNLTYINIPDSVKFIEGTAFSNCTGVSYITIPKDIISIGTSAFYNVKEINYTGSLRDSNNWGALYLNVRP